MKKRHFDMETDGFYGAYWKCKTGSGCAMIAMIGDDSEDYLARTSVKWLHKLGVNVMTMSPGKKDYGHHNYPLERIEKAINWLKVHGNQKIGIVGASRSIQPTALCIKSCLCVINRSANASVSVKSERRINAQVQTIEIRCSQRLSLAASSYRTERSRFTKYSPTISRQDKSTKSQLLQRRVFFK